MAARLLGLACTAAALNRPQTAPPRPPTALGATRQATLGLGCFWAPSEELLAVDGVVDTRCGYAGAVFPDARPSYASVCGGDGNVEAVQVTYDDAVVSYEAVLDAAFAASKPVLGSRQYAPIVFASDGDEAARAAAWVGLGGVRDDGLERRAHRVRVALARVGRAPREELGDGLEGVHRRVGDEEEEDGAAVLGRGRRARLAPARLRGREAIAS